MIDTKKAKSPGCILLDILFYISLDIFSPHSLILDLKFNIERHNSEPKKEWEKRNYWYVTRNPKDFLD